MKKLILGLMLRAVLNCGILLADTHYVSPYGSDTYPYTSWETAADSIQKGIDAVESGDTVRVGAGTYREMVMMIPGIVLLGAGMDSSIIYPYKNSGRDIVYGQDSSVIEGFHIRGWEPLGGDFCVGIRSATDSKLKRIANNKISQCDDGIYLGITNTEVSNNIIEQNETGISSFITDNSLIFNNTLINNHYGFRLDYTSVRIIKNLIFNTTTYAIQGDFTDSIFIENNLIVVGAYYGISLSNYSGEFKNAPIRNNTISADPLHTVISVTFSNEIKNNVLMDGFCGVRAYRYDGYSCNPQVSYNDLWNNVENYCVEGGASIDTSLGGNIYLDPMFMGGDDYHLQYGSPCIDAGDPNIIDPDSSRSDMGCYGGTWGETYPYQDYPPRAPDSLKATSSDTLIVLSWKPNTESDLSHYLVYKDVVSGFIPDSSNIVGEVEKDSSVFWDFDVVSQQTYYYLVSAWDLTGNESDYSDELPVQATDVDDFTEEGPPMPRMYQVRQNYPNPFNPSTTIVYYLPDVGYQPAEVEMVIYNLLGQKVRILVKEKKYPGEHKVTWDGKDDNGNDLSSGIYFYKLTFSGVDLYPLVKPKKMVLLR
jgi:parallel beta-helix repeat protein